MNEIGRQYVQAIISKKMWIPLACSLLCITAIFIHGALQSRNTSIEERQRDLSNIDEIALNTVKRFAAMAESGAVPLETAKKQALNALKDMRYGENGYIAVNNMDGVAVMNPIKPEIVGKDLSNFRDAEGNWVFRDIATISKTESGTGFTQYVWPRPGAAATSPKLTRIVTYKPWGWSLITGIYIDDIDARFKQILVRSLGVLIAVCALLALIVTRINRSLFKTLGGAPEYAAEVASRIAASDLSQKVQFSDGHQGSVLHAMKVMQENLTTTISDIRASADAISSASVEVATASMDLSERTEMQASSLEETAASMEELTATVKQNADNARDANALSQSAFEMAVNSNEVVRKLVSTMGDIDAKSGRIGDIISVIDGIAFQANILALNAAVEAARAREHGRGFAVVAAEVRSLARNSAEAARDVKALIKDSRDAVQAGVELAEHAREGMQNIMEGAKRVTTLINEISAASQEQASGIEQVTAAVSQMDEVTQKNAAMVEESASAAGLMRDHASHLLQKVSVFRFDNAVIAVSPSLTSSIPNRHAAKTAASSADYRLTRDGKELIGIVA